MNQQVTSKPWGKSIRRFINGFIQFEEIHIKKGGFSSVHYHERKWNEFLIQSGSLRVNFYHASGKLKVTHEIEPGIKIVAPPKSRHQFIAHKGDVVGYEIYYDFSGKLDSEDIVRFSTNGCYVKIEPVHTNTVGEYCGVCNRPMKETDAVTIYLNGAMRNICRGCSNVQRGEVDGIG